MRKKRRRLEILIIIWIRRAWSARRARILSERRLKTNNIKAYRITTQLWITISIIGKTIWRILTSTTRLAIAKEGRATSQARETTNERTCLNWSSTLASNRLPGAWTYETSTTMPYRSNWMATTKISCCSASRVAASRLSRINWRSRIQRRIRPLMILSLTQRWAVASKRSNKANTSANCTGKGYKAIAKRTGKCFASTAYSRARTRTTKSAR